MMKLVIMTHSGPGLWVLSQALLLLYFYLDNGSNVCGLEFNYKKKRGTRTSRGKEEDKEEEEEKEEGEKKKEEKKEGQEKEEDEEKKEEKEKEKEENKKLDEGEEEKQDKMEGLDDTKSLLGANKAEHETFYNDQIFRQLFLGFEVKSEEGRLVSHYS